MLRWTILRRNARLLRRTCLASQPDHAFTRFATERGGAHRLASITVERRAEKPSRVPSGRNLEPSSLAAIRPKHRADAWLALLEPTLPPHLRSQQNGETDPALSASEVFEVLTKAEQMSLASHGRDILSYIAYEKGRWDLVVWLAKHLVESFATSASDRDPTSDILSPWKNDTALDELTRAPVDPLHPSFLQLDQSTQHDGISLQRGTTRSDSGRLAHKALGMIWRSLGHMTMTCADGDIRPEILEIIACLHHQGYMPSSIYDSKLSADPTAIQQSPILDLLSPRILTSLSDAAWRAHERVAIEGNPEGGKSYASRRTKILGTAYHVRVTGLKPEVWLELILWSCLHGGWIAEGIQLLEKLHQLQWRPLSWRLLVSNQPTGTRDWEHVEYLFNNWAVSYIDLEKPMTPISVQRTVSSEVVNAFVDASISITRPSRGQPGRSVSQTIEFINAMQLFLGRSSLSLGAGSWDAIILRLFDQQHDVLYKPTNFDKVIRLSPTMGQETSAVNSRTLPDYVFDGTAAVLGLFHRALHYRIKEADVGGALRLFASLQHHTDANKRRSVTDFLRKQSLFGSPDDQEHTGQFTDNYASIDYPAFFVQIPPTILGPFIELVTEAKAYDFGKWLLYSEEIDGPVVPQRLYGDPSIMPALVRFAAETSDKVLLSRLVKLRIKYATEEEPVLPEKVLESFLESQINLMRWEAAVKILTQLRNINHGVSRSTLPHCHLLRVSLLQARRVAAGDKTASEHLARARGLFQRLVRGSFEKLWKRPDHIQEQIDILLVVLAAIGHEWTGFSVNTKVVKGYRVFNLPTKGFNLVLEGVVDAYGSQAGRKLIGIFWSHKIRSAQALESESDKETTNPPFSSFGRTPPRHIRQQRTEIRLPGVMDRRVVVYAGLRPDLMTIRLVLKKAIEEFEQHTVGSSEEHEAMHSGIADSPGELAGAGVDELNDPQDPAIDLSPCGMVIWGARCMKRLGMTVEDLKEELRQSLSEDKFRQALEKSPGLLSAMEESEGKLGKDCNDADAEEERRRLKI